MLAGAEEAGGEDAGGDEAGGEDAGGEEAGGDDAGGEDAGGEEAGGEDAGGDEAGGEDAGGEEAGGDDAGGEDAGGLPDPEPPGCVDPGPPGWVGEELSGTGGRDVLALDKVGVKSAFGDIRTAGRTEDEGRGLAGGFDVEPGAVAITPAPVCGWAWPSGCDRSAPISAKAASPEATTSPPVRHAEATGRRMRCRL